MLHVLWQGRRGAPKQRGAVAAARRASDGCGRAAAVAAAGERVEGAGAAGGVGGRGGRGCVRIVAQGDEVGGAAIGRSAQQRGALRATSHGTRTAVSEVLRELQFGSRARGAGAAGAAGRCSLSCRRGCVRRGARAAGEHLRAAPARRLVRRAGHVRRRKLARQLLRADGLAPRVARRVAARDGAREGGQERAAQGHA